MLMSVRRLFFALLLAFPLLSAQKPGAKPDADGGKRENLFIDAMRFYNEGNYMEAAWRFELLADAAPADDAPHYYLALIYAARSEYESAEKEFRTAVSLDPGNFWYRCRLASLYAATGRPELAEAEYKRLLEDFPDKNDVYYSLIEIYMSEDKMDEALGILDQIETVYGKSEPTAMARFEILGRLGRQQEAFASLEEFNVEYSSPQVLSVLGDYQMSMYNDSTALSMYDEALDIEPGYAPALLGKAEVYRMTRRYDEYFPAAAELFASENVPAAGKSDYLRNLVQRTDPNFIRTFRDRIDTLFSVCTDAHPSDSTVLSAAGLYYYATGRFDESEGYFRRNMEAWPGSVAAAAEYNEVLMYLHRWEELSASAQESFARFPSEPAFLELAVLAEYNLKDYDAVLSLCSAIISADPSDTSRVLKAWSTIGDTWHLKGENKKAYKAYDKALKIDPDCNNVLNNYAYWLSMEGKKLKKAYTMSRKTVSSEPDNPTYLDTFGWILFLQGKAVEAKPFFKHAMLYGGKDSAVILDHYAEVLYALGEYDTAFIYWNQASAKNTSGEIPGLESRIEARKAAAKK